MFRWLSLLKFDSKLPHATRAGLYIHTEARAGKGPL